MSEVSFLTDNLENNNYGSQPYSNPGAASRTFYVSSVGNDNDGGGFNDPLLTISKALEKCVSNRNDTIILLTNITEVLSISKNNISIIGYQKNIRLVGSNHNITGNGVKFFNLFFRSSGAAARIIISTGDGSVFENCYFFDDDITTDVIQIAGEGVIMKNIYITTDQNVDGLLSSSDFGYFENIHIINRGALPNGTGLEFDGDNNQVIGVYCVNHNVGISLGGGSSHNTILYYDNGSNTSAIADVGSNNQVLDIS